MLDLYLRHLPPTLAQQDTPDMQTLLLTLQDRFGSYGLQIVHATGVTSQ